MSPVKFGQMRCRLVTEDLAQWFIAKQKKRSFNLTKKLYGSDSRMTM